MAGMSAVRQLGFEQVPSGTQSAITMPSCGQDMMGGNLIATAKLLYATGSYRREPNSDPMRLLSERSRVTRSLSPSFKCRTVSCLRVAPIPALPVTSSQPASPSSIIGEPRRSIARLSWSKSAAPAPRARCGVLGEEATEEAVLEAPDRVDEEIIIGTGSADEVDDDVEE